MPAAVPDGIRERCPNRPAGRLDVRAERLLDIARDTGLGVSPSQTTGRVELDGLLEVSKVHVVRSEKRHAS
jgi:hypothetical protein